MTISYMQITTKLSKHAVAHQIITFQANIRQ